MENNCNIHLTSGNQGYRLVRLGLSELSRLILTCHNYVGRVSHKRALGNLCSLICMI